MDGTGWLLELGAGLQESALANHQVIRSCPSAHDSPDPDSVISVAETALEKPGGLISNNVMPPGIFLDNMPNREYRTMAQTRDLSKALRGRLAVVLRVNLRSTV